MASLLKWISNGMNGKISLSVNLCVISSVFWGAGVNKVNGKF